ncbi:hypothetical protein [Spirosoma oryzicola]|uniref:hypothetical protein n=1 Tax=Spirosoma oryzicola TaxID=2898794 RepID=UPI001E3AEE89|nr:hypothetical protein [Spirosoma oryzicola]UHG93437.1 hypothetical protein LQ777_11145 [Spirosoma oryzicola]
MTRVLFRVLFCTLRVIAITALIHLVNAIRDCRYQLLLLAVAGLIAYLLSGCSSFESAFRKYGQTVTDTTMVTVPVAVTIPRDSAVITVRTDTSRVIIEEHNRTSWVRLYRDKNQTRVEGGCDSATIAKDVLAKVPRKQAIWGVDPKYKTWMERWRTAAIVLFALIAVAFGLYSFTRKFIITPRNGTAA